MKQNEPQKLIFLFVKKFDVYFIKAGKKRQYTANKQSTIYHSIHKQKP